MFLNPLTYLFSRKTADAPTLSEGPSTNTEEAQLATQAQIAAFLASLIPLLPVHSLPTSNAQPPQFSATPPQPQPPQFGATPPQPQPPQFGATAQFFPQFGTTSQFGAPPQPSFGATSQFSSQQFGAAPVGPQFTPGIPRREFFRDEILQRHPAPTSEPLFTPTAQLGACNAVIADKEAKYDYDFSTEAIASDRLKLARLPVTIQRLEDEIQRARLKEQELKSLEPQWNHVDDLRRAEKAAEVDSKRRISSQVHSRTAKRRKVVDEAEEVDCPSLVAQIKRNNPANNAEVEEASS